MESIVLYCTHIALSIFILIYTNSGVIRPRTRSEGESGQFRIHRSATTGSSRYNRPGSLCFCFIHSLILSYFRSVVSQLLSANSMPDILALCMLLHLWFILQMCLLFICTCTACCVLIYTLIGSTFELLKLFLFQGMI